MEWRRGPPPSELVSAASLMSFEKVSQRLQLVVEAFAEVGQAPSWKTARFYKWVSTLIDAVSLALRQCGTRRAKEEVGVGVTRVQQLQGVGLNNAEVDGASPVGETGRGRGRGGRGDGRGGRGQSCASSVSTGDGREQGPR